MSNKILFIISILIVLVMIGLGVYTLIQYGNKPIDEIPSWVLWLLRG